MCQVCRLIDEFVDKGLMM